MCYVSRLPDTGESGDSQVVIRQSSPITHYDIIMEVL